MASTTASTSTTPAATEIHILQETIETVLAQEGRRYSNYLTFAWRFEADDSSADKDTAHFQAILKLLELPEAVELVIEKDDEMPQEALKRFLYDLLKERLVMKPGRCLLIGHYAGHGSVFADEFFFAPTADSSSKRCFAYAFSLQYLTFPSTAFPDTDSILILDSCFSGSAKRHSDLFNPDRSGLSGPDWSGELVCSVGPAQKMRPDWSKLARGQDKTFTSRLMDEVIREVRRGSTTVSLIDLIANLRKTSSADRLPEYQLEAGKVGIQIPNLRLTEPVHHSGTVDPSATLLHLSPHIDDLSVIFQVHLHSVSPEDIEIEQLFAWSQGLHHDLELIGVYQSRPTIAHFRGPYQLWAQLNGLPRFSFVCEIFGRRNMLEDIRPEWENFPESPWDLGPMWQPEPLNMPEPLNVPEPPFQLQSRWREPLRSPESTWQIEEVYQRRRLQRP